MDVGYDNKDGLGHDKKTGRTEEETRHEDFVQIHDVNNPPEKTVHNILQAESSGEPRRLLANPQQTAAPRAEERTATTRGTSRGSTRKRRKKILFQQLRKKRRKVPLTWRSWQSS
jgi:hypothetical protein